MSKRVKIETRSGIEFNKDNPWTRVETKHGVIRNTYNLTTGNALVPPKCNSVAPLTKHVLEVLYYVETVDVHKRESLYSFKFDVVRIDTLPIDLHHLDTSISGDTYVYTDKCMYKQKFIQVNSTAVAYRESIGRAMYDINAIYQTNEHLYKIHTSVSLYLPYGVDYLVIDYICCWQT